MTINRAPRITICGIPELGEHFTAGVTHVVSILGPNRADPPEFAEFAPHRRLVLRFHDVIEPLPDQIGPTRTDVERLLMFGRESARRSTPISWCTAAPGCRARPQRPH